ARSREDVGRRERRGPCEEGDAARVAGDPGAQARGALAGPHDEIEASPDREAEGERDARGEQGGRIGGRDRGGEGDRAARERETNDDGDQTRRRRGPDVLVALRRPR